MLVGCLGLSCRSSSSLENSVETENEFNFWVARISTSVCVGALNYEKDPETDKIRTKNRPKSKKVSLSVRKVGFS